MNIVFVLLLGKNYFFLVIVAAVFIFKIVKTAAMVDNHRSICVEIK